MVQANELRRNNKIYRIFETHRQIVSVLVIEENKINYVLETEFEGIPLSPELLVKCEFEMPSKIFQLNKDWFLYDNYDGFFIQIEKQVIGEYVCERLKVDIKYLHQLQNLYYSLTQQELPVNL